jgi:hypothetical protein
MLFRCSRNAATIQKEDNVGFGHFAAWQRKTTYGENNR